jgi:hypothetical protein
MVRYGTTAAMEFYIMLSLEGHTVLIMSFIRIDSRAKASESRACRLICEKHVREERSWLGVIANKPENELMLAILLVLSPPSAV